MPTPAEEAVQTQDAAAERLFPAWVKALTAARTVPSGAPVPEPPSGLKEAVVLALLFIGAAVVSSAKRRDDTSFEAPAKQDPAPPSPTEIRQMVEDMAPEHVDKIWRSAVAHVRPRADRLETPPRSSDREFARRASWVDGAEATSKFQLNFADKLGLTHKVWVTRGDDRVRTLHRELHGSVVEAGDPFHVWPDGQSLNFPGDTRAPMDAWVNCRCFLFMLPGPGSVDFDIVPPDLDRSFALAASLASELEATADERYVVS